MYIPDYDNEAYKKGWSFTEMLRFGDKLLGSVRDFIAIPYAMTAKRLAALC